MLNKRAWQECRHATPPSQEGCFRWPQCLGGTWAEGEGSYQARPGKRFAAGAGREESAAGHAASQPAADRQPGQGAPGRGRRQGAGVQPKDGHTPGAHASLLLHARCTHEHQNGWIPNTLGWVLRGGSAQPAAGCRGDQASSGLHSQLLVGGEQSPAVTTQEIRRRPAQPPAGRRRAPPRQHLG